MKNRFLFIVFFILFGYSDISFSESFILKSKNLKISDKDNQIDAFNGKAFSQDGNLEIYGDKLTYFKDLDILRSYENGEVIIHSENIKIKYKEGTFDQQNLTLKASENITIYELNGKFIIETEELLYDQKKKIITSSTITKFEDKFKNIYFVDSFNFNINKNLLKVKNLISKDYNQNILKSSIAYINTESGKIFGKDIEIDLHDPVKKSNLRLIGKSAVIDENTSEITKGVFTTCKKRDGCSPWKISSKKIIHNKKKKELVYDKALLKIYDNPVAYFPKFFYPDPTVERKTGFLIPSITNSSNFGNYIKTPFFYAISENKDMTFSPRIYDNEKILLQTEYRKKELDSSHIVDLSLVEEKNKKNKNHIFYKLTKNFKLEKFKSNSIDLNLQHVSADKYLKAEKINSNYFNLSNTIENSINIDMYSNDLSLRFNSAVYENLDKSNNDRYEFVIPRFTLKRNIKNLDLNGKLSFKTDNVVRQFDTNVVEKRNVNDFYFNSFSKINKLGLLNNYEFLIRNTNQENKNSNYKNEKNFYLSGIFQYNSSYPLKKENKNYLNILRPRLSIKTAPNHTKNQKNEERKINMTNIYTLDRATDKTFIEGGMSLAYGIDYSVLNKFKNNETLNLKLANNFRLKENSSLIKTNQINQKTSNILSEIIYRPNENITTTYISSFKNNLKDINNEILISEFNFKNFKTTFDYLNENDSKERNSYLSNLTSYYFDKQNNFSFSTRKNKTKDLTEYYNFMYQYKNDCLSASIGYNKSFYNDRELKPEKNINFKLTLSSF